MRKIFLFLLVVSSFVFSADKYSLSKEDFRIGEEIKIDAMTAIGLPGKKTRSVSPQKPNGTDFYMRRKIDGRLYGWYFGVLNPVPFRKFFAFDLLAEKISSEEAMFMRFYGKRKEKPYRDEPELYFDGRYLYSPRVPVLYFVKNGEWQRLEAVLSPGLVTVVSSQSNNSALREDSVYAPLPQTFFPVSPGIFHVQILPEKGFTYIDAIEVFPNKSLTLRVHPMESAGISQVSFYPKVTKEQILKADSLEVLERYYDLVRKESLAVADTLSYEWFEKVYPKKKSFTDTVGYDSYSKNYDRVKEEAKAAWAAKRLSPASEMSSLLMEKIASFERPDTIRTKPAKLKIFRQKLAESMPESEKPPIDSIQLGFTSPDGRIDLVWRGSVDSKEFDLNVLVATLKAGEVTVLLLLDKNKPVWIFENNLVKKRVHYRYTGIQFDMLAKVGIGKGVFILPDEIMKEEEVALWLKREKGKKKTSDSLSGVEKIPVRETPEDSAKKFLDSLRGDYVVLDSSTFRFRGKVVGISSFAIHLHEVSQKEYDKVMKWSVSIKAPDNSKYRGENKPVENITWDAARAYCKVLGGDLPTEAQWEYAARAGGNDGFIWDNLGTGRPEDYAVFKKNSGGLSKKDSAYGPHAVASKKPNGFGLYDMAGNVAEWTRDNYSAFNFWDESVDPTGSWLGHTKIYKGGSFKSSERDLNLTARDDEDPRYWSEEIGFRCVFPVSALH